jgi:hypothetical protein
MLDRFIRPRTFGAAVCVLALGAAPFVAGCDDSPSTPSDAGTLRIMLTDAPTQAVDRVNVFVTGVTVKRVDRDAEQVTLNLTPNPVDLLTLRNRVVTLAAGDVAAGQYEWVEIRLDESRSSVVQGGASRAVDITNETIRVNRTFSILENVQTVLTLDFDASASLSQNASGGWVLAPVISVTGNTGAN